MSIRDFKKITPKTSQEPAVVRDQIGRVLREGDLIHLQTVVVQPYRVVSIVLPVDPQVPVGYIDITLQSTVKFRAARNQPNLEFLRVATGDELHSLQSAPVDPPSLKQQSDLRLTLAEDEQS